MLISLYGKPAKLVIGGKRPIEVMETSNREKKNLFINGPKNGATSSDLFLVAYLSRYNFFYNGFN